MTHEEAVEAIRNGTIVTREMILDGLALKAELEADPNWDRDFVTDNWIKRTREYWVARGLAELAVAEQQPFAEIALQSAVTEIISRTGLIGLDGPPGPIAPDKGNYEEIASFSLGGTDGHDTSTEAISCWKERLAKYMPEHEGDTLWWRVVPEILGSVPFGSTKPRWQVYSRLRIGDAGLIAREIAEQNAGSVVGLG